MIKGCSRWSSSTVVHMSIHVVRGLPQHMCQLIYLYKHYNTSRNSEKLSDSFERGRRGTDGGWRWRWPWQVFRLGGSAYFRHYPLNIYENCFCCSFIHFVCRPEVLALHAVLLFFFLKTEWHQDEGYKSEGSKTIKLKISIS